jgi:hypothetical protein
LNTFPPQTKIGRSALRLLVVASAFSIVLLACTQPDFRTFSDPVMSTDAMQAELERLHAINLTVANGNFDPSGYSISGGVDFRNGKMLVDKFICWDSCPDVGMVFLLYQNVESSKACNGSVVGTPLFTPEPILGEYWGCRPIMDWLNRPEKSTD